MIDSRQAVQIAKQEAAAMLGEKAFSLEELERADYKGRDVWSVTLGFPRDMNFQDLASRMNVLSYGRLEYKVFLIDVETGHLVAMKLREPAIR